MEGGRDRNSFLERLREVKEAKPLPKLEGKAASLLSERLKMDNSLPSFVSSLQRDSGKDVKRLDET